MMSLLLALTLGLLVPAVPADGDTAPPAPFTVSSMVIDPDEHLQMLDMDGDGALDFVRVSLSGVSVHLMRATGAYPAEPDVVLDWDAGRIGWQLADIDSDGQFEVLVLSDARQLSVHRLTDGSLSEGAVLLENARAALPRGIHRVPFARDIDEDGLADMVIPAPGGYRIYRMRDDGSLSAPIQLAVEVDVGHRLGNAERVDGRFRQSVRIPWFSLRDIDGDGLQDLVAESDDAVQFYLAQPEFAPEPTWTLDLELETDRSRADAFGIDFDNLLGTIDDGLTWRVQDLDGVAPNDLVLHADGVFRVYLGGSIGNIDRTPDQLLKVSGNVMHYLLRDVTDDGRLELQVIRGPKISVGQVLRRLVIPGALDFDIYTYDNKAGAFSTHPSRRSRLRLEIPGLISLADREDEASDQEPAPARRLRLTVGGETSGIVDVVDGEFLVFADAVPDNLPPSIEDRIVSTRPDDLLETFLLRDMDSMKDGSTRTITLEELMQMDFTSGDALRAATTGRQPAFSEQIGCLDVKSLRVIDLDGNGLGDVTLTGKTEDGDRMAWIAVAHP
jgi:hypothetical protein